MSERDSNGDEIQVDEIKEFIGINGVKVIEVDGKSNISFDFGALPELSTELNPNTDYTVIWDTSASAHKKVLVRDLPSSLASVGTFQLDQQVFGGGLKGTTSGTHTWNKPTGCKAVYVLVVGAGGGGGSGRRGLVSTYRSGGGGGAGGCVSEMWLNGAGLGSSVTITIGEGGAGGASQTTDSTNGNAGTAGGASIFGDFLKAAGGNGGGGGTNNTTPNNRGTVGSVGWGFGVPGSGDSDGAGDPASACVFGPSGGGGGGGVGNSNTVFAGGAGGRVVFAESAGVAGAATGANGANGRSYLSTPWFGSGAAGGGASITADAGSGGHGYGGAGGGGGAGCLNSYLSGAGGNGGDGMVIVLSFF